MEKLVLVGIDKINREITLKNKKNEYFLIEDKNEFTIRELYEKEMNTLEDTSSEQYWKQKDIKEDMDFTCKCKNYFYSMFTEV